MYEVENILKIEGDPKHRRSWNLTIKFVGYPEPEICGWNSTLLHEKHVHAKLREMGGLWAKHIPEAYQIRQTDAVPSSAKTRANLGAKKQRHK